MMRKGSRARFVPVQFDDAHISFTRASYGLLRSLTFPKAPPIRPYPPEAVLGSKNGIPISPDETTHWLFPAFVPPVWAVLQPSAMLSRKIPDELRKSMLERTIRLFTTNALLLPELMKIAFDPLDRLPADIESFA